MALIANLDQPMEVVVIEGFVPPTILLAFPTPPISIIKWGFGVDVENSVAEDIHGATSYIVSAVSPEASHLEPAIGQIWPRIG